MELRLGLVLGAAILAVAAAGHALISKRDSRAALGWIALALLQPVAGPFL